MNDKNIAIIPARGGSKRIPRKNIKDFLGKPVIAYSIDAAIKSGLFDEIMVSTDDKEIAEIAIRFGAKVPFMRSRKNADNKATTMDVIQEVLNNYKEKQNKEFKYGCCIYPTAPLIKIRHLKEGFEKLKKHDFITVFPVVAFSYPIWRGLEVNEDGKSKMIWTEYINSRSQDLKEVYHDAGQWYWLKTSDITNSLITNNTGTLILDELEVQDIDNLTDWKSAEIKFKLLND